MRIDRINGPLSPADAAAWARLHADAFADEAASPWSAASFADMSRAPYARLYAGRDVCGALVALAATQSVLDEADILTLAVAPSARRAGGATRVMQLALADLELALITRVFLEVAETNRAARAFYKTMAFIETGRRLGYYTRGAAPIDAIIMRANLNV